MRKYTTPSTGTVRTIHHELSTSSERVPMRLATRLTKEKPEEASCVSTWSGLGYRVRVRVRATAGVRV